MSLKYTYFIFIFLVTSSLYAPFGFTSKPIAKNITIIFDLTGDSQQTGRKFNDRYERSITLQCVQELKKMLSSIENTNIIITRTAGQTRTEFDTAQLANRLHATIVIHVSAYHQTDGPTTVNLYRFSYNPYFLPKQPLEYAFIPYDQAYVQAAPLAQHYADVVKQLLDSQDYRRLFVTKGVFGIPFKPLIGIQSPAIAIELGLNNGSDWQLITNPLAHAISQLIKTMHDAS